MDPKKLRVSSKVLAQASDVFKMMVDHCEQSLRNNLAFSRLAVGGQRSKERVEDLFTIPCPLQRTSQEASILFFNVLHHQTEELPQKLSWNLYSTLDSFVPCSTVLTLSNPGARCGWQGANLRLQGILNSRANSWSQLTFSMMRTLSQGFRELFFLSKMALSPLCLYLTQNCISLGRVS